MDDVDFQQAKAMYIAARKKERARIRSALQGAGFQVKSGNNAGQGLRSYTSGGRLSPPCDLSNWMWIEAQRDGVCKTPVQRIIGNRTDNRRHWQHHERYSFICRQYQPAMHERSHPQLCAKLIVDTCSCRAYSQSFSLANAQSLHALESKDISS